MDFLIEAQRTKGWKKIVTVVLVAMAVGYVLWMTSGFVLAFRQVKRAHIYPTNVNATGWSQGENALTRDLSPQAPSVSFSQSNSAYLFIASSSPVGIVPLQGSTSGGGGGGTSVPVSPSATSTDTTSSTTTQATTTPASDQPAVTSSTPSSDTSNASSTSDTPTQVFLPIPTSTPPPPTPSVPVVPPATDSGAATTSMRGLSTPPLARRIEQFVTSVFSDIIPQAFATTTDDGVGASSSVTTTPAVLDPSSVSAPNPDLSSTTITSADTSAAAVATCTVLGDTCHMLEFSGFGVAGSLTSKEFKKAELKFSFAQIATLSDAQNGKLSVRYFHTGRWHSAGEIYLDQDLSNATNGGYFTQTLDGVSSWDDLSDVRVVFEYEPGDGASAVQLYLDAVWIDAVYVDQVQDVLSGNMSDPTDAPQNVSFDVTSQAQNANTLVLADGSTLAFPFLDALDDSLAVRVDRATYQGSASSTIVFASVTNTGTNKDSFKLFASFPGAQGTVTDLSQYMRNVPQVATTTQTNDVTYFCDDGWSAASSTGQYTCVATAETYTCATVSDTKQNCLVSNVPIGVSTSTAYGSQWVSMDTGRVSQGDPQVTKGLPQGYQVAYGSDKGFDILPGQTVYFRVTLTTLDTAKVRFVLSAKGDAYFGDVDSMHLRDETYLKAQLKSIKPQTRHDYLNDQLSEQSDFNVTDLPQFHFKFKTQRGFFTRLKDFLLGRSVPFKVQSAQLHHASGELEHLPVDIEYGANDEWTFKLEKGQRDFRPGKYSVDLTMNEGGATYTDSVPFYWGVLAENPDKSSYEPGEVAHISISALDDKGDTMCDAQLMMSVTDPSGATSDVPVVSGGGCGHNNITTLPDFIAEYATKDEGAYTLTLARLDDAGNIVTSVTDTLTVKKSAPYVVTRTGPTRIYPKSAYSMQLHIDAPQGFTGTIVEPVPEGFAIADPDGAVVSRADGVIYLTWNVAIASAAGKNLSYTFKAPEVSPYMYSLGPLQLKDVTGVVFTESRTWKLASDATAIATGVAWLAGNATTYSSNLSSTTAYALTWNLSDDYDTTFFSHSTTTNNSRLTVNVPGDYLVALTVPIERADTTGTRTSLEADIRVNGNKQNIGVSRAFIRTIASSVHQSSDHLYVLLHNLHTGDYIESFVHNNSTATDNIAISGQASMYAEFIGSDQQVYFGLGTTTTSTTTLNATATTTMAWYDDPTFGRSDSNYTHNNTTASSTITLGASGPYMVFVNVPISSTVTNVSPKGRILLNGVIQPGAEFKQGFIANTTGVTDSSLQWSGVVNATTSGQVLTVAMLSNGAAGMATVNNDTASIYIQQLPASGVYFGSGTTTLNNLANSTNWNVTPATSTQWTTDTVKDASVYTHATSTNSQKITVLQAGDYLLALNDSHAGAVTNANMVTQISVNGAPVSGAQTKTHFIPNGSSDISSSGSLVYLLRNLAVNDVVTVTTVLEGASGAVTEDKNALLMLWHKSAQSSFTQDTERWYANVNAEPPTDPWPSGSIDLDEGDPITTGVAVKSGDVLRLRMALTADVNTIAGADSFKLQYAPGTTCSLALTWSDVGATGSGAPWRGYHNASLTAGQTLSTTTLSVSSTTETYEEQNPSAVTPHAVSAGTDAEWDWVLQDNGAPVGTNYCFRMVQSSGQILKDYTGYPQLITNNSPDVPTLAAPFDNEKTASTSPWFTFTSSDDNGDDIHYEIQVSTDPAFGSTVIDEDSATYYTKFSNTTNSADKAPFGGGQIIQYTPTISLSNGTTYWWRVRAKDPSGTNSWSSYSSAQSITIDTSVTVSTWFQTTQGQFANDTLSNVNATVTDDVQLSGANTSGTIYSPPIDYTTHTSGNSWGTVSWTNTQSAGNTITYHVEYFTSTSSWAVIPNSDLPGNSTGTTTGPISLGQLDPGTYNLIRVRGDFVKTTTTPILSDWTVSWALSVAQPTLITLFDNEKTATTTPTFTFTSTDPQSDDLQYQIQWSTDANFVTGVTTRTSGTDPGFLNVASSTDTSPFVSGNTISFAVQASDRLASSTTYWWRVRAQDPGGGATYSLWSSPQSFTTDTTVQSSTWFQTTNEQFNEDLLTRTGASGGGVTATSTTGSIAIYRANAGNDPITTSVFSNYWDTTVRQDSVFSLPSTTTIQLLATGHYAVIYGLRFRTSSGSNRSEIQSYLNLAGVSLPIGWSQAFIRRNGAATQGFSSGGGIINVQSSNSPLIVQSFRTDTNSTAGVMREATSSGVSLIKLDDAWSYARLSKATKQTGPISTSWMPVTWDREDEIDTTAYAHASGASGLTLKNPGHYLVFANTYGSLRSNNSSVVDQKIKLDNADIDGSFATVFMNGNANSDGDYQGAASIGTIIQSTTTNQVLTVQVARSLGTAAWTIDGTFSGAYVNRSGLTVVKLPDADFIRLQNSTSTNMDPTALTPLTWNTEAEKDASFTHSTTTTTQRITANTAGDYLFLTANYAAPGTTANAQPMQGWRKNGGTLELYGQSGSFNTSATADTGSFGGIVYPGVAINDYFESIAQARGTTGIVGETKKGIQGLRIGSLAEADTNPKTVESPDIVFSSGTGPKWSTFSWNDSRPSSTNIVYRLLYLNASSTYSLVPDVDLPGNSTGFSTTSSSVNISNLNRTTYGTLRTLATFTCAAGNCPTLNDWTVSWSQGINISGTARAFDQTTNASYGTVGVAVNGVLQAGKTGTIAGGAWTIPNVTAFTGDIITVFVSTTTATTRAVAVTKYTSTGDITGMKLYQMHLTLGSDDAPVLTNTDISQYDNSVSGNSAIFDDVSGGNLNVCAGTNCANARLLVMAGTTYEPGVSGGNVTTPNLQIDGTLTADANTITVSRSWKNNAVFNKGTSTVIFSATSTNETIDSSTATSSAAFNNVTFGQTSSTAIWTLVSPLYASSTLSINYGMLQNGAYPIALSGDLTIGSSGNFYHGTGTTTFMGTGTNLWTDNNSTKQDMGTVVIDGTSKTIQLGASVKATNITIGSNDVLDASSGNYGITVNGNWTNNNSFVAQGGTVTFAATTTGKTITAGASNFYNLTFNGVGGNWSFANSNITVNNNFTVATGTVTMPIGTTTVAGSFDSSGGAFIHNNGAVIMTATAPQTINPGPSSFYDLAFNGSGSWSFTSANATSSRNTTIAAGSVTLPSGTFVVGGAFAKNGGSFSHNSGTIKFTASSAQSIYFNTSSAYNLWFTGSGPWAFTDTNATTSGSVTLQNGTVTFPSGTLAIGGSLLNTGGAFTHNGGTVRFTAATTGFSVTPGSSAFYNLLFDSSSGGWTITNNATSTNNTIINAAANLTVNPGTTLTVGGTFTNNVGGSATTFANATLYLNSGTSYSLNTKAAGGDVYGTLSIGASTNVRMWNSSAATTTINSTGSLYSQNNASVPGSLYIYGAFTSSGNEYWSAATDFDGAALASGSQRQVQVRIASSSSVTFSGGIVSIVGSSTATTTISNQGVGTYSLSVTGGTLNAQYYQVASTTAAGLSLSGTTNVTSLSNGDFTLSLPTGGTSMTVNSSVINQNPLLQIQQVRFATTTGVTGGYNVTEVGAPTSYWWFRNHYGNFAGEAHNSDPGGNPGYIRWDDSGYNITVSGHVYSDHGSTIIGNPPCDGSTPVVTIVVGANTYSGSCGVLTGAYSISGVQFTGDVDLVVYLNTNGGKRAVTVTKTPTANISDLDLYQNALIVRHEGVTPVTITDLAAFDSTRDSDISFAAATSTMTLTTQPGTELYVWTGKTFAPGGNITLQSGGSGGAIDGRLYLAANATFTAAGTQSHSIGGGMILSSGATFTAANSTLTFAATTTGKSISAASPLSLYNLTFNGSGGQWSLDSSALTTVTHALTMTTGTLVGTGDITVQSNDVTGSGTIAMTNGTFTISGTGNFGSSNAWQFKNLTLGDGVSVASTTKTGTGTTTVTGVLTIAANQILNAGSSSWVLTGGGTPLSISGTLNVQSAPFTYAATSATNVANANYASLTLAPSGAGSPTYTLGGGTPTIGSLTIGNGTNPVTVTADSNDPSIALSGTMRINAGATYVASNVGALTVAGSWINSGTFTHSNAAVLFNATTTGNTIQAGNSPFYDVTFNSSSGGWTITGNATSTDNTTLSAASNFTVNPGMTLAVGGTFMNGVGGSATTFASSTLYLNSGTSYTIDTKAAGGDTYGTLLVGASTNIRMWNSSAATTTVNSSGSLYSMNHAGVSGALAIWGSYNRSSGSDYWSYSTDFDGTDISGSPRQVTVSIASSSSLSFSGGVLDIIGAASASTTVQNQGAGAYSLSVSGGTLYANYYQFRNLDSSGVNLSGTPTVTSLSYGDFQLAVAGGSLMTVAGSVIDANPLKIIKNVSFATTTAITGYNVTEIGTPSSSWKFNLHYGNLAGEAFDNDPGGDPGYIRWDNSASQITISGHVYADEGTTVSTVCDNSTPNVKLVVEGSTSYTTSCNSSTGAYSMSGISFNPGDTLTLYLDTNGGKRAADVSVDPISNITGMDLYENRVIVRHEDTVPITIADMSQYTSANDSDIPFSTTISSTNTLTLPPNTKLIVWDNKTFAPAGNVTIQSGGSANSYDGTLEVRPNASFSAASTQTHSIGGSLIFDSGATLTSANSTFVCTATTTGKTITPPTSSSFYNLTFNGAGGNWAFSGNATTTNDVTVTLGTVTFPTGTLAIGGSLQNTGGTFVHNNGTVVLTATATGKSLKVGTSTLYNLTLNGAGGGWSFTDTNATTSNTFSILNGTVTLPSGVFAVGNSFLNTGGIFTHNSGTVKFTATASGKQVQANSSNFNTLLFSGVGGSWTFVDPNITTVSDFAIATGTVVLPSGVLTVGGSFFASSGAFTHNNGTVTFAATATGKSVTPGSSSFYNLIFNSASGGWTITSNATSTNNTSITAAANVTVNPGTTLAVGGTFTNSVGGAATVFATSTLSLYSGTSYTIDTKTTSATTYGTLLIGANTNIRMWNSSAATTTVSSTGSLYSMDHGNVNGALDIWGAYARSAGSDYWDYATDFDGTALGGGSRQVNVYIATSSTVTYSGGSLDIVGGPTATTTVQNQGAGAYTFTVSGGTLNALYYQFRNLDASGLTLSGTPSVTSLNYGDFQLAQSGGTMLTVAGSVIDANASARFTGIQFATSSGVSSGYNVVRTGSPVSAWTFAQSYGNYSGEAFDNDGGDACGNIRWDNSTCLFVNQTHYRWRNDDGGEGALTSQWYDNSWSYRKKVALTNPNAVAYTNFPVKLTVTYDSNMKSDFSDLRFTDSSGTTSVPYFVESYTASVSAVVWVNVPSLPSAGSATVYMYYGNAAASDASSGSTTFRFYDSFESGTLSGYSGDTGTKFNVGASFAHNGAYGLDAGSHAGEKTTNGIYRTGSQTAQGTTIRYYQYVDSSQQDEPCTLFGVQSSGHNYAVCLEEYPSQLVALAKDVTSNDTSGSIMTSTGVTYATGWYQVSIDWLASTTINVTVYNSSGSVFATLSTTTSAYSSGGMGFSYWFQHGGWDYYSVRTYAPSAPTAIFGAPQGNYGATWASAEDTGLTGLMIGSNVRLRVSVQNTGAPLTNQNFRLQWAAKGAALNCESIPFVNYGDVPAAGSCGSSPACMTSSSQFTNLASTSGSLSYPASMNFAPGEMMQNSSNQTNGITVGTNAVTELEYNFQMTSNATGNAYCFRSSKGGLDFDSYDHVAQATILHAPTISNISFNGGANITLIEGTTTTILATSTVTDLNGYADMVSATSTFYRSGVGPSCTANNNNCYQVATSSCSFSACSGTSCTLTCSAPIQYFADPTDAGSPNYGQHWLATMAVQDSTGLRDTETLAGSGIDVWTLYGLALNTLNINFGSLYPGQDTGSVNATTTVINTGNSIININLVGNGTGLVGPGGSSDVIPVNSQKYATSTFVYGSCAACQLLSGAATNVAIDIPKPVSTSTPSVGNVYWGISIPNGKTGAYTGSTTIEAAAP